MLGVEDFARMAVRSALEVVPKSAGMTSRYVVSLEVGTDAAVMDDGGLREAVRERLKAEGPAVRYSVEVEHRAERPSRVKVRERVEAVNLTERDHDVLGFLAIARRLTADQLIALAFPGRHVTIAYRRLALLASARPNGGGYVRQDFFFGGQGNRAKVAAWSVTNDGYSAVAPLLPYLRPYSTAPAVVANLQHDLWLNDLFVAMATARGAPVNPGDLPFRWLCDTDKPIAFRTLDDDAAFKTNLLRPDAIVELPLARRRIFIEAERGTHTDRALEHDERGWNDDEGAPVRLVRRSAGRGGRPDDRVPHDLPGRVPPRAALPRPLGMATDPRARGAPGGTSEGRESARPAGPRDDL